MARRISLTDEQIGLIDEAVDYHYLTDLAGYGVPLEELSEEETETHRGMVKLKARLARLRDRIDA